LSMRSEIEEVADRLQSLAAGLRAGTQDPQTVEKKLSSLAEDLDELAQRLKRAARE
jgi:septal ring factor EnvC (AmiA/AmiB activator)